MKNRRYLNTAVGAMRVESNPQHETFPTKTTPYWLLDSQSNYICDLSLESYRKLKNVKTIEDLVELGIFKNIFYSETIDGLTDLLRKIVTNDYEPKKVDKIVRWLLRNSNKIGNYYFVCDTMDLL